MTEKIMHLRNLVNELSKFTDNDWEVLSSLMETGGIAPALKTESRQEVISNFLLRLGIAPNIKGYNYLLTTISLVMGDETYLDQIVRRLYPEVSKIHNTTPIRVERAIRHAIGKIFSNVADERVLNSVFYRSFYDKGVPTNSEFIATAALYIRKQGA